MKVEIETTSDFELQGDIKRIEIGTERIIITFHKGDVLSYDRDKDY